MSFCGRKCTSGAWESSRSSIWREEPFSTRLNLFKILLFSLLLLTFGVAAAEGLSRLDEKLLALQVLLAQLQKNIEETNNLCKLLKYGNFFRVTHLIGNKPPSRWLSSGSFGSWWATSIATYCPGKITEHLKSKTMGGCYQQDGSPCR